MSANPTPKLSDYKVIIFDVYGTLMDWETGIYDGLQPLLSQFESSRSWTRKEALQAFGSVEVDLQSQFPDMLYSDLLAMVHRVLEKRLKALSSEEPTPPTLDGDSASSVKATSSSDGESVSTSAQGAAQSIAPDADAHQRFGNSIRSWPIFPDTSKALHALARHFKLVVLSNVDRTSFQYTHGVLSEGKAPADITPYMYPQTNPNRYWHPRATPGSNSPFTLILTAQDTGCYKPALGGFQSALEYIKAHPDLLGGTLGEDEDVRSKVLIVAQSLIHDHVPANLLGINSVWIDRQSAVTCNELPGQTPCTWRFETLGEMAEAVENELGSSD